MTLQAACCLKVTCVECAGSAGACCVLKCSRRMWLLQLCYTSLSLGFTMLYAASHVSKFASYLSHTATAANMDLPDIHNPVNMQEGGRGVRQGCPHD